MKDNLVVLFQMEIEVKPLFAISEKVLLQLLKI